MNFYTKTQKFISFILIFSILFSFTINISFFSFVGKLFASEEKNYNLVSIFVAEDIYSAVKDEVKRYAEDVQGVLENTKTIIIPTPIDENPFNIASINEKLYFEGYKGIASLSGESHLIGSVFIGNLALPVVENSDSFSKTIFPYVDFENKLYIYNHDKNLYEINNDFALEPKAEIWHGFISPNTGNRDEDISLIKGYFEKNHKYYLGEGNFQNEKGITNGVKEEKLIDEYEPYVFYYDQLRESKSINYVNYKAYQTYLSNMEDINYNRFSKEFAKSLSDNYLSNQTDYIGEAQEILGDQIDLSDYNSGNLTEGVPDIQTRSLVANSVKRFIEIFNGSTIGDIRKNVYNAGRYNSPGDKVGVDIIPYLASNVDLLSEAVVRNVNNDLETKIDDIVKNGLSRNIAIPTNFSVGDTTYTNFLYGNNASNILNASSCSIYRGSTYNSGTLVQGNRGFDVSVANSDASACNNGQTFGYWGGYSPMNLDASGIGDGEVWKLKTNNYLNAVEPLFSIKGAKKVLDESKVLTPQVCYENNFIQTQPDEITCSSTNPHLNYALNFDETYNSFPTLDPGPCEEHTLILDGRVIKTHSDNSCASSVDAVTGIVSVEPSTNKVYNFKSISSYIEHKSPTAEELGTQVQYLASPNLPIDRDRYIDFIAANNTYGKINYPYLFRIGAGAKSIEETREIVKNYLDEKSREINDLINAKNPGNGGATYSLLKTGPYPEANVDLHSYLQNKEVKELEVLGDEKGINYFETLVFSVYWNNLNSVSAKYKFIFENYLSDQFGGNDFGFYLPENKKQYEISYLGAPGDSKNMYVKVDPEEKGENPYADILAENQNLSNQLNFSNTDSDSGNTFNCAPPEGVPIWEWIPAVMCRLKDMLPPTISINSGSCGYSLLSSGDEGSIGDLEEYDGKDTNNNGINDYLEDEVSSGYLMLTTNNKKYYFNRTGTLKAKILNGEGDLISFDNSSKVKFELVKVEDIDGKIILDKYGNAGNVVYDEENIKEAQKYVNFRDIEIRASNGTANYNFSTRSKEGKLTFKATLVLENQYGEEVIKKETYTDVLVAGDLFYSTSYNLSKYNSLPVLDSGIDSVTASDVQNIFLVSEKSFMSMKENLGSLDSISSSSDKLFISLANKNKSGENLNLSYPIKVEIFDPNGISIVDKSFNNLNQINSLGNFTKAGTYIFEITDSYNNKISKEIEIMPSLPSEFLVSLGTNLAEKGGVITTNFFNINDKFSNPTSGNIYEVKADISGNSITFEDGKTSKTMKVYEGYKLFNLKTTNNTGDTTITFKLYVDGKPTIITSKTIRVVDNIEFDVTGLSNDIKVGGNKYDFTLNLKNIGENINFNSRAYLISNGIYVNSNGGYFNIENNSGNSFFTTTKKAGEGIELEFKIEGVKESFYKKIDILPDIALRMDLSLSKSKIEASTESTSQLIVELKDRYDNIVWNDNSSKVNLEILDQYKRIITSGVYEKTVSGGKTNFILNATDIPGIAFFKTSTDGITDSNKIEIVGQAPFDKNKLNSIIGMRESNGALTSLGKNFFEEHDLSNYRFKFYSLDILKENENFKKLSQSMQNALINLFNESDKIYIYGLPENAGRIDTYYFWNKEKIDGNKYNSIYTTLLGASYGDITIKDNLANSLIFDKNNRALGVTSLLNDTSDYKDVLNIKPNGNILLNEETSDLSHDISTNFSIDSSGDLGITFFNSTFSKLISNIYFTFKKDFLELKTCETNLDTCLDTKEKDVISLKNANNNYETLIENGVLKLKNSNGETLISVDENGKINKKSYLNFEINDNYKNYLALNLKIDSSIVGVLAIKLNNSRTTVVRDTSSIDSLKNNLTTSSLIIYLENRDYFYKTNYLGNSTKDNIGFTIYYNDPFSTEVSTINKFTKNFEYGYESFYKNEGVGWKDSNKILLSFSAGDSIGEATKNFQTFSLINIGDPVVSLKPITKKLPGTSIDRKFDSTIGTLISNDSDNISYSVFDYNNDSIKDIVILKRDGYIKLLEGTGDINNFIDKGNVAYIADYSTNGTIQTGDFTGDSFDDILLINKDGKPLLLNNVGKDFIRVDLGTKFGITGRVMQAISRDMDEDSISDIVVYEDIGKLTIFYGKSGTSSNPQFDRKLIDDNLGVKLNPEIRNDNSLLYYDGLYQLPINDNGQYLTDSDILTSDILDNIEALKSISENAENEFNEGLIDAMIFSQLNYTPLNSILEDNSYEQLISNLPIPLEGEGAEIDAINDGISQTSELMQDMLGENGYLNTYNSGGTIYTGIGNDNTITTFIKSQYLDASGLKIEKSYVDLNGGTLTAGDKIELKIDLTNTTNDLIENIALIEDIPTPFSFEDRSLSSLSMGDETISFSGIIFKKAPDSGYDFLIDSCYSQDGELKNLSIYPEEKITLTITLETKPFNYGYIEAGLFEEGEEGDDNFGDIIFKENKKTCSEKDYTIYRSIQEREYEKGLKSLTCEKGTLNDLDKNNLDADGNNIPDYIDELIANGQAGNDAFLDYSNDTLSDLLHDTDNDGLPDDEDISPGFSPEEDFMSGLDSINENVDAILEGMDIILEGLSCGFGGGSCIASPLNWAPLAPGSDPTLMGFPIGDGLKVGEGLPVFAVPTIPSCPTCPPVWPPSPLGAGGRLDGVPTGLGISQFRLFVTPTITGAVGVAMCFGPNVGGWLPPPGLSPFAPGGNCVVAAAPLIGCSNDGSDGEIYNVGFSTTGNIYNGNLYGNCSNSTSSSEYISEEVVSDYLTYKTTGNKSTSLIDSINDAISDISGNSSGGSSMSFSEPLISAFEGAEGSEVSVEFDSDAFLEGNFEDVLKVKMDRIAAFPDFLMDWVTRQIEEIVNKLTDFPTLFIILPDFSGIFDTFDNFIPNIKDAYNEGSEQGKEIESDLDSEINSLNNEKAGLNCDENTIKCSAIDIEVAKLELERDSTLNQKASGIKAVYKFLSNLPLIAIKPEKVYVNFPNIDLETINKAITDFELTKKQWQQEIQRAKEAWSFGNACAGTSEEISACEEENELASKIIVDAQELINSIDQNIEILKEYKQLPEKLHKLIKYKEIRLEQILCNIENLSEIMGGRIGDNGKRFKAWVELYILIKAILKSWQLLIDIFIDYETECHQCKNERYDLMHFLWKLISFVIPKIPVIQFPKWPDIYLDLHNIRVGLTVALPEFEFNLRPILLPTLPNLYLPDVPNVNINLPSLPLLPTIEIPDLPLLPSIPEIELPDLPPPPTLPKLFGALEGILNILKLITKAMCFIRSSSFVPEWRAGDLIAFKTERQGYLGLDFLDISLPQFSLPFVDAIKVTTWVNLEFEAEFLVEAARQSIMPVNVFTNDIVNMLNIGIGDLDFRNVVPSEINIELESEGSSDKSLELINPDSINENIDNIENSIDDLENNAGNLGAGIVDNNKITVFDFAMLLATKIGQLYSYIEKESDKEITTDEFKKIIASEISKKAFYENEKTSKIAGVWDNALKYSFEKENKLIDELKQNNTDKFNKLREIIEEEIAENKKLGDNFRDLLSKNDIVKINSITDNKYKNYNNELLSFNLKAIESALSIGQEDKEVGEIKNMGEKLKNEVTSGITSYSKDIKESSKDFERSFNTAKNLAFNFSNNSNIPTNSSLLAYNDSLEPEDNGEITNRSACNLGGSYSYVYKGLYFVEKYLGRKISYRLFDYTDETNGDEEYHEADINNDGNKDAIYMVGNEIFVKENLTASSKKKDYYTGSPIMISSNNVYFNDNVNYYEAINSFEESVSDNNHINISFKQPTNKDLSNFRVEFFTIVDKFSNLENENYSPEGVKRYVLDAFRDIDEITLDQEESSYKLRKNLAYLKNIGNLAGVDMHTKELINLQNQLENNNLLIINAGTKIYSSTSAVKLVYYDYKDRNNDLKYQEATIKPYSNIEFKNDIVISSLNGDLFVEGDNYKDLSGNEIVEYIKKPLFPGTIFNYNGNLVESYVGIEYYDGTSVNIDFSKDKYYELVDLGKYSSNYLIRTKIENDYYYSKIRSFKDSTFSTYSKQVLLSPQIYSDKTAPEITGLSKIQVPVYQKETLDLTDNIFEDSSIDNIKDIFVDFDLETDTSGDADTKNDSDYSLSKRSNNFNIKIQNRKILFEIGPFYSLQSKKIRLNIVDKNNNIGTKDISFVIYAPNPTIKNITSTGVISGGIDLQLDDEPISFYRLRGGNLRRLTDKNTNSVTSLTDNLGKFSFTGSVEGKGLVLKKYENDTNSIISSINEDTGKIDLGLNDIDVRVYPSNHKNNDLGYPKIILSKDGEDIYYEYLVTPNVGKVTSVTNFQNITDKGVYYKHNSNLYDYFEMPLGIENNAGDLFIYSKTDDNKTPIVTIYKDGKINTINSIILTYDTFGDYVVYNIIDGSGNEIGKVMIIPEKNYVIK